VDLDTTGRTNLTLRASSTFVNCQADFANSYLVESAVGPGLQGLNDLMQEKDAKISALEKRLRDLENRLPAVPGKQ